LKYEAIIFDLDGVIFHTDQYHYTAWKEIADKLNIPFDENINNRLRGVERRESLDIILANNDKEISEDEKQMYLESKNITYKNLLTNISPSDLSKEVKDTLQELRLQWRPIWIAVRSVMQDQQEKRHIN